MSIELAIRTPYNRLIVCSQGPENKTFRLICKEQYLKHRLLLMFRVTGQRNIYSTHCA
jgi:hypothetical protein